MFQGTSTASGKTYTPKTGLAPFKVIAINPTKEEINSFLGREYPFDPEYGIIELNGVSVRPIHFWVRSEENNITESIRFYVGKNIKIAGSGSTRYVNAKGQFKYAKTKDDIADWNPVREAVEGEYELYSFIQRLIRYKPSAPDANFLKDAEQNGMSASALYENGAGELKKLLQYFDEQKCFIGLVLAVRPKQKDDVTEYRQVILSKPEAFFTLFTNKIGDYQLNKLKEIYQESVERGYPLTNDLFTFKFQDFNLEDCVNKAPDSSSPSATMNLDLPF